MDDLGVAHPVHLSINDFLQVNLQRVETSVLPDEQLAWISQTRPGLGGEPGRCRAYYRYERSAWPAAVRGSRNARAVTFGFP